MRIVQYYPWVYLTSGIERVILEICRRSRFAHHIYTNHYHPAGTYPELGKYPTVELPPVSTKRDILSVLKAASTIYFQSVDLSPFNAMLVHCEGLGDLIMRNTSGCPAVCFCHTPLRPVYDPEYRERALERYSLPGRLIFRMFSLGFKALDRQCWKKYRYVFFNSSETLRRAEAGGLLNGLEGRYEVLHPGIDWKACCPTGQYDPYFLVAGRIMWTKNIEAALQGFRHFKAHYPGHSHFRLVIAGQVDQKSQVYLEQLKNMTAMNSDVDFVISPTDQVLNDLYANCHAVLFPPFNEDWGIVPLEANAYAKPVIAVNRGGPVESQIDGKTGYLVSGEPEAFSRAMGMLAGDIHLTRRMGEWARVNVLQYDWKYFVRRIDAVLEEVTGNRNLDESRRDFPPISNPAASPEEVYSAESPFQSGLSRESWERNGE